MERERILSEAAIAAANAVPPVEAWPPFCEFWPLGHFGRRVCPGDPPHRSVGFRLAKRGNRHGLKLLAIAIPGRGLCSCDLWLRRFLEATAQAERLERGEGAAPARRQAPRRQPARAADQRARDAKTAAVLGRHGLRVGAAAGAEANT